MSGATMTIAKKPPHFDIDPFSDENLADPTDFQNALLEAGPVVYIEKYDIYAVGRYDELKTVMSDYQRFSSTGGLGMSDIRKPGAWRAPSPISEIDPPHHTDVRGALTKILSPIVIRKWREQFSEEAEVLAGHVVPKGEIEAVKELVETYVLKVFPDVLAVDMPRKDFRPIGEMNSNQVGPMNDLTKRSMKRAEPILESYQKSFQREAMLPGGFGEKIYQAEDAGEFQPGTAGPLVRSFLRAGMDTTIAGIGLTLKLLAENPDQFAKVKETPAKLRNAFEETIRLYSPSTVVFRTTLKPVEFSGFTLEGDKKVAVFMSAANLDPRKFENPDRFDVDREVAGVHVGFGNGPHVCIGQMIARLEAECLLGAVLRRVKAIELTGRPEFRLVNSLRTLERLPLRLIAA